ncbi:VOC family protein [Metabacillus idriensis]|uniref:VOC family protein n=1 Tax=Metabacillus idriensis TaxID=324768 RepID=UPI00174B5905|nr:VOC family protein [Metabacillus idriensis]
MTQPLLKGIEGVFIPVSDVKRSVQWYEDKLGFKPLYIEKEAAVMKIADESQAVICLVLTPNHQPMIFPENHFGVGKYFNFIPSNIEETHRKLIERGVAVNPMDGEGQTRFFTFFDPDGNPLGACQ